MDSCAMESRFPHFYHLFVYDEDGCITSVNKEFEWNNFKFTELVPYIQCMASNTEWNNLQNITDVKSFLFRIYNVMRNA
jgi:hypothetical protein